MRDQRLRLGDVMCLMSVLGLASPSFPATDSSGISFAAESCDDYTWLEDWIDSTKRKFVKLIGMLYLLTEISF